MINLTSEQERQVAIIATENYRKEFELQLEMFSYPLIRNIQNLYNQSANLVQVQQDEIEKFQKKYPWVSYQLEGPAVICLRGLVGLMDRLGDDMELLKRAKVDIRNWTNHEETGRLIKPMQSQVFKGSDPDVYMEMEAASDLKALRVKIISDCESLVRKLEEFAGSAQNIAASVQSQCVDAEKKNPLLRTYHWGPANFISSAATSLLLQCRRYIKSWS